MLADLVPSTSAGHLNSGILVEEGSRASILNFIKDQLPQWRDRPNRPKGANENDLTSQLSAFLTTAARKAGLDWLQFQVEKPDESRKSRKIDLVALPCETAIVVEGRTYSEFETILPIECKRLPIPTDAKRDTREYVYTQTGSKGGIQRYKEGKHGAAHNRAALIAYVEEHNFDYWVAMIEGWIKGLHSSCCPGWSTDDLLTEQTRDMTVGIAVHESTHKREHLSDISLQHLWILMPSKET